MGSIILGHILVILSTKGRFSENTSFTRNLGVDPPKRNFNK
jgi:hypothetical protein